MKQKFHFIKLLQLSGVLLILIIAISITAVDITTTVRGFNILSEEIRTNYIAKQKQRIQQEVMRVVTLISFKNEQSEAITRQIIKSRTDEASAIAQNIYLQNKTTKTKKEILQLIIDALRPIRYANGYGYYFITDFDGNELLFADKPELEGQNLLHLQDSNGKYVIRDMIAIATQAKAGSYEYHWTKPDATGSDFRKVSFVKHLEPFDCFVGTGLYFDGIKETIKAELLERISRIRFGRNGYIFVNSFDGDVLVGNGTRYSGTKKLWEVFNETPEKTKALFAQEHAAALTPDGDYIYYTFKRLGKTGAESPKSSFIYGIPELQWLVGAGVYLDDVEKEILLMQDKVDKQITKKISYSTFITLSIVLCLIILIRFFNRKLQQDTALLISFFNHKIISSNQINRDLINFHEFDEMATNINTMFMDKILAQSQLKSEEISLLQSEEKYRDTMEATLIGVYIVQDFVFQYVNPAMAAMFGYTVKEMEGKLSPIDLVIPEQRKMVKENLIRRATGELTSTADIKCLHRDGSVFDTLVLGSAIIHEGKPASVGTMLDITDRKASEEKLKKSEKRATALLEAIPDMVFRVNSEGVYLDYKADPTDLHVTLPDAIIGKTNQDLLPPYLSLLIDEKIKETLQTGEMKLFEYKLSVPGSGKLDFEARMVKSGEDEVTSIVRNMTERKKARNERSILEKQLYQAKRMESIGLMAGGVAHDLNNILAGIVGYPELILQTLPPEENRLRPQIKAIHASGKRAAAIVDDLLTVARGAASTRETHDLNSLVTEYLDSLECSKVKSVYPHVTIEHWLNNDPVNISCSEVHIKKCIMNLVTNGIEAIEDYGTILISTRIHTETATNNARGLQPGQYIVLEIKDSGPGIVQEDLEHIFEPFYSKKTMARSGTGLGLTVVWNTVQDHSGKIFVESSTEGTLFQLYFPQSQQEDIKRTSKKEADVSRGNGEHILVVDDESQLRDIASQILTSNGYTVDSVSSGEAAVQVIKSTPVDLLIIDMLMEPGINGYQTYKEILKINPKQKAIIASGFSENSEIKATLELGAGGFIKKPYSLKKLCNIVKQVLDS